MLDMTVAVIRRGLVVHGQGLPKRSVLLPTIGAMIEAGVYHDAGLDLVLKLGSTIWSAPVLMPVNNDIAGMLVREALGLEVVSNEQAFSMLTPLFSETRPRPAFCYTSATHTVAVVRDLLFLFHRLGENIFEAREGVSAWDRAHRNYQPDTSAPKGKRT